MDSGNMSRTSLPPIQYLTEEKKTRSQEGHGHPRYRDGHDMPAPTSTSASYPAGPPPPYTASSTYQPQASAPRTWTPVGEGTAQYYDSRTAASEAPKRLLPSLSEALGVSSGPVYTTDAGRAHPAIHNTGVAPVTRRSSGGPSPPQPARLIHDPARHIFSRPELQPSVDVPRPRSHEQPAAPSSSYHTARSPTITNPTYSQATYATSPHGSHYDTSPKIPRDQSRFGHGFGAPPVSALPATNGGMYPPVLPRSSEASAAWRAAPPTAVPPPQEQRPAQAYSDSVKRHLDFYDFEVALNEISEQSSGVLEFSRQYSARFHQSQRPGVIPATLPEVSEVDKLIAMSRQQVDALGRMKDVLVAHQVACLEQSQQTRSDDGRRNDSILQPDDPKDGGFAGSEPKKRRGRNAAPGRCHSCNRAETPEWRRGPDGARTLCNACGLHYAKLTRKAGVNKAALGSSSLRPKTGEDDSEA